MEKLIGLFLLLFGLFSCSNAFSLTISHNGTTLTGTESNFTFAMPIWTNTSLDKSTFTGNGNTNYLLLEKIELTGSFQISAPLSQSGAQVSLYRLDGSNNTYTTTLVKSWSGAHIIGRYYISQPGEYLVQAQFPGETYPHISFDFLPDNTTGQCINLQPSSGLSCDESWMPAHYRRDVEPWLQEQFDDIEFRLGRIVEAKRLADAQITRLDNAIDAAILSIGTSANALDCKLTNTCGGLIEGGVVLVGGYLYEREKHHYPAVDNFLSNPWVSKGVDNGIIIVELLRNKDNFTGCVTLKLSDCAGFFTSWASAVTQLGLDTASVIGSGVAIKDLNSLEENLNEISIVRRMLESLFRDSPDNWGALVTIAGLNPVDSPNLNQIINGIAAIMGFENSILLGNDYNASNVSDLFYQARDNLGDWIYVRKRIDNPLDDIDGDGYLNKEDADPNNPLIPEQSIVNIAPVAAISTMSTNAIVNSLVNMEGSGSYDVDSGLIVSYQWDLVVPTDSNTVLSSTTSTAITFVPDIPGAYEVTLRVSDGELNSHVERVVTFVSPEPVIGHDLLVNSFSINKTKVDPGETVYFDLNVQNSGDYTEQINAKITINGPGVSTEIGPYLLGSLSKAEVSKQFNDFSSYTFPSNASDGYYSFTLKVFSNSGDGNWINNFSVQSIRIGSDVPIYSNAYRTKCCLQLSENINAPLGIKGQFNGDGGYGPVSITTPFGTYNIYLSKYSTSSRVGYYIDGPSGFTAGTGQSKGKEVDAYKVYAFDNGRLLLKAYPLGTGVFGIDSGYPADSEVYVSPTAASVQVNSEYIFEVHMGAVGDDNFNQDIWAYNSSSNTRFNTNDDTFYNTVMWADGGSASYGYDITVKPKKVGTHEFVVEVPGAGDKDYWVIGKISSFNPPLDSDNDGVIDSADDFISDPAASVDSDGDGYPDSWNIGKSQSDSLTGLFIDLDPNNALINVDTDSDGVADYYDAFINDATETYDSDGDGIGDNSDAFPGDISASIDTDGDTYPNVWNVGKSQSDSTTGLILDHPSFVNDSTEWFDSDSDGVGDNADKFDNDAAAALDSDNDGYPDSWNIGKTEIDSTTGLILDLFPFDPAASIDSDGDGYPDRWNPGNTVADTTTGLIIDYFPNDITEWIDTDFDGVGDNSDWAPNDYSEWVDFDGDGVGDNLDAFPNDVTETLDSDLDGIGNNADFDDDNDGIKDHFEVFFGTNPLINDSDNDKDGDGISNFEEFNSGLNFTELDSDFDGTPDGKDLIHRPPSLIASTQNIVSSSNGKVFMWGDIAGDGLPHWSHPHQINVNGVPVSNVKKVGRGSSSSHNLILLDNGSLFAWGNNFSGNLGIGTNVPNYRTTIEPVFSKPGIPLSDIKDIDASPGHSLALTNDGYVLAWGSNLNHRLGTGIIDSGDLYYPTKVIDKNGDPIFNIISISTFNDFNLALTSDGKIYSWGYGEFGQLGNGGFNDVQHYADFVSTQGGGVLTDIVSISAGATHALALKSDGTVWQWGLNDITGGIHFSAFKISTDLDGNVFNNIIKVSAGGISGHLYSMALSKNGQVFTWGIPMDGRLGDGNIGFTLPSADLPRVVLYSGGALEQIVEISAGNHHSLAMNKYGQVFSWGDNTDAILGVGFSSDQPYAADVIYESFEAFDLTLKDTDQDDIVDINDNCPSLANADQLNTDGDTQGDACDSDDDGDMVLDIADDFPLDINESVDTDLDGIGNNADIDDDNDTLIDTVEITNGTDPLLADTDADGVNDNLDVFPLNSLETVDIDFDGIGDNADNCSTVSNIDQLDTDNDGLGNVCDVDDDNDTILDTIEVANGTNPILADTDGDGINDNIDAFPLDNTVSIDTDNDGVSDGSDNCPAVANSDQLDTDSDGQGNACDTDDDNDLVLDIRDSFPLDSSESVDSDGDGVGDNSDTFPNDSSESNDTDGDGVGDYADVFINDETEWLDSDGDGYGNNQDTDDDNDGLPDTHEVLHNLDPLNASDALSDLDGDGVKNLLEYYGGSDPSDSSSISNQIDNNWLDSDLDEVPDSLDHYPSNSAAWINPHSDFDNDGIVNTIDAFPIDTNEWIDTDGDNVGDNSDVFPTDGTEAVDSDLDGVGNNTDSDDDNDGVLDINDAFPLDASESLDSDGDGIGDNSDPTPNGVLVIIDSDGDGVSDEEDAFPNDPTEKTDTDLDTIGDNSDNCPQFNNPDQLDTDLDGQGDLCDRDDDNDGVNDNDDSAPLDPTISEATAGGALSILMTVILMLLSLSVLFRKRKNRRIN